MPKHPYLVFGDDFHFEEVTDFVLRNLLVGLLQMPVHVALMRFLVDDSLVLLCPFRESPRCFPNVQTS